MTIKLKEVSLFLVIIGLWLIANPISFGYYDVQIFYNDISCGILLIILGIFSFIKFHPGYFFPISLIGFWLSFAPLAFWAPEKIEYLNDTATGLLVLIFAFQFLPYLKGSEDKSNIPIGWSFNPSKWSHRVPIIFLAVFCWLLARYLDGFELGYYERPWDPFFGDGTLRVLSSKVSHSFPVPDAGLGALAYTLEALLCWQGGENRWKKVPWLVLTFGILALPVSMVSILLITLQPLAVDAWCFLCLCIAFLMLFIVILAIPEVLATLQCMKREHALGNSMGKFLIYGSSEKGARPFKNPKESYFHGISPSWNQILLVILTVVFIIYSTVQGISEDWVKNCSVISALVIAFTIFSMSEILRPLRFIVALLALYLAISSFIFILHHPISLVVTIAFGIAFILLSLPKGKIKENYGTWNNWIV